jgi:hypothetical protein
MDCDGARPSGVAGVQCNTPDWVPPEGQLLSVASDQYKLGLFILRCLSPGEGASTLTDPARIGTPLDHTGMAMLTRALGSDLRARPSAQDWYRHLSRVLGHPVEPPRLVDARLDEDHVLLGRPCTLSWQAVDAVTVEIRHGAEVHVIDGRQGAGALPINLTETGYVHVRALNDIGSDHTIIGPVAVIAPPEQVRVPVPMPELAWPMADLPPVPQHRPPDFPVLPGVAMPDRLTAVPDEGMRWPTLPAVPCPVDVMSLLFDSPELDLATLYEGLT